MITNNGNFLKQSVMADEQMRALDSKREDVFARLRALGVEVSVPTHDSISLAIPKGKEDEAYAIYRELLPSGELRFLDPHKEPEE